MRSLIPLLALLVRSATAQLTPNVFGLHGAQNAILFLNGFYFISGAPDYFLYANHYCVLIGLSFL